MRNRPLPTLIVIGLAVLIAGALLISTFIRTVDNSLLCTLTGGTSRTKSDNPNTPIQLLAILHYATSRTVPQQSLPEISISFDVLQSLTPCNFLVFGLGLDSLMWSSFNPRGTTLFLEDDPTWVDSVLKDAPTLRAHTVRYHTKLSEADHLLSSYHSEPNCHRPSDKSFLRGNTGCKLALSDLPSEVYDMEWDLIMIDAPKGYYPEAPGRMSVIYSSAVMARSRKKPGVTHVFLHDVDRRVEKVYAEEFLCRKYLVNASGRLWHFEIPPATNVSNVGFC